MPRAPRQLVLERVAQGAGPEPVVEVAEHDRRRRMTAGDLDQPLGLAAAFADAQAEMGRYQTERAALGTNLGLDRAPRLAFGMGDVMHLGRTERPAAHDHLAVVAVGRRDRLRLDTVLADRLA